jgi:hypothetical protein
MCSGAFSTSSYVASRRAGSAMPEWYLGGAASEFAGLRVKCTI